MYKYGKDFVSLVKSKIAFGNSRSTAQLSSSRDEVERNESKRPAIGKGGIETQSHNDVNDNDNDRNDQCNRIDLTLHNAKSSKPSSENQASPSPISKLNENKKRVRRSDGYKTPMLVHPRSSECDDSCSSSSANNRSVRRFKRQKVAGALGQSSSLLLAMIPHDVLEMNILTYLTDARDFRALQLSCRDVRSSCNKNEVLKDVNLFGESESGNGSILYNVDSPTVAVERLYKFASAANHQALYMIGMITAYCHGDRVGVTILKQNARRGCVRSAYALGLILRDCDKVESEKYLNGAIEKEYLPACQELLSSQAVKDKFGDLSHETLKLFFDPIGLNRLLSRCYLHSNGVRGVATSHCWNPCCGRWALKATSSNDGGTPELQCPSTCLPDLASHIEASLVQLVQNDDTGDSIGLDENYDYCNSAILSSDMTKKTKDAASMKSSGNNENEICLGTSIENGKRSFRVSRMKMCSSCRRAKYCSKLCQVYDWRSGRHKMECQYL